MDQLIKQEAHFMTENIKRIYDNFQTKTNGYVDSSSKVHEFLCHYFSIHVICCSISLIVIRPHQLKKPDHQSKSYSFHDVRLADSHSTHDHMCEEPQDTIRAVRSACAKHIVFVILTARHFEWSENFPSCCPKVLWSHLTFVSYLLPDREIE